MTKTQITLASLAALAIGTATLAGLRADECTAAIVLTPESTLQAVVACGAQAEAPDAGEAPGYEVLERLGTFPRPEGWPDLATHDWPAFPPELPLRCAIACGGDCRLVESGEPAPTCQELAPGSFTGAGCLPKLCGEHGSAAAVYGGVNYSVPDSCRAPCGFVPPPTPEPLTE